MSVRYSFFKKNAILNRLGLIMLLFIIYSPTKAHDNLDSLIASWNKLSQDYIKVNEIDSACKYGNCVVEMMDIEIESSKESLSASRITELKRKKVQALSNLVTAYGSSDEISLAKECFDEALEIFYQINDPVGIFHLYIRMGRVYDNRSSYNEAILYYNKAQEQAKLNGDKEGEALCYYYLGLNNRYLGNYYDALKNHLKDLQIQEELNNKKGIAGAYITIAAILKKLNDLDAAINRLNDAKLLFEQVKDTFGISMTYNDLGIAYEYLGDTVTALENHEKAARLRSLSLDYNGLGASYNYIARIYLYQENHAKALHFLHKAELSFRKASNLQGIMSSRIEMSTIYIDKNELDSTLIWLNLAEDIANEIMNYKGLIEIYSLKGEVNLIKQKYNPAIGDFKKALTIAEGQNSHPEIYNLHSHLAEIYYNMGLYEQAFNHQSKCIQYKDSVEANANFTATLQMEMEYNYKKEKIKTQLEQEKKDALIQTKLSGQKTQKKLYILVTLMFLMISIGLWSRLRYIRKSSRALLKEKEKAEQQKSIAESERERATQSEKIKEQFLANMSHEIRTPLNAIKGMTEIIIRNVHPKSQDVYLNAIQESSENLLVIVNEILDLSKLNAGKIELEKIQFNPNKIIDNVHGILRYKAEEKGLKLIVKKDQSIPPNICGDPTRLSQILINLAGNAIKFTEKGKVVIEVVNQSSNKKKANILFKVKDTGIGIAPDKINSIFDLFTQADIDTSRKYGGTGLGLSICKQLVALYDGKISVESIPGKGSTFFVEIPFDISKLELKDHMEEISLSFNDLKILLAEDNEFNIIVAQDALKTNIPGVVVDVAKNGKEAIEMLNTETYDLILMDVQMPEMDGYEATAAIRKMNNAKASIPIIALTANVLKAEVNRCYQAGMNGYLSKPIENSELIKCISKTLNPLN
jgi:signal transduction histidine kinase/CheY-like chemotaxis protein